ncbi:fructokinase [Alteromonadaceae bacterium Bs31]|nr:fructokinase [Alteromonadaceae bacterium Bs31]
MSQLYGAIEAGGTKFVCAVGTGPDDFREIRFPTFTPEQTLQQVIDFFAPFQKELQVIGIGSFGPIDLHPESQAYGYITSTPKAGWANTDILGTIKKHIDVPLAFDTDVNAAALAEGEWGAAQDWQDYIYLTIGTGIGGGVVSGGKLVHGLLHPELGHCLLPKHPEDGYRGKCPYHHDQCFEGLASGPAIAERWQQAAQSLPADHFAWQLQADYIAKALMGFVCTLSPQGIILGGGVMEQQHLIGLVRDKLKQHLNGYIQAPRLIDGMDSYLVRPDLGTRAGILGALLLGQIKLGGKHVLYSN